MDVKIKDQHTVELCRQALRTRLYFEKIGQLKKIFKEIIATRNKQRHRVLLAVDAEKDNLPIGVLVVLPKTGLSSTKLTRTVHVYVDPQYREVGVATKLFDHLKRRHKLPGYLLNTRTTGMSNFFNKFNVFEVPREIGVDIGGLDFKLLSRKDQIAAVMQTVGKHITIPEIQHVHKHAVLHARSVSNAHHSRKSRQSVPPATQRSSLGSGTVRRTRALQAPEPRNQGVG